MEKGSGSSLKKRTAGKRKISIELIKNNEARQVCFSKRRQGLFKKATELSVLCGAHVRVVAFSPAGNPFHHVAPSTQHADNNEALPDGMLTDFGRRASELRAKVDASNSKNDGLKARQKMNESMWANYIAMANLAQLAAAKKALETLRVVTTSAGEMGAGTGTIPDMGLGAGAIMSYDLHK